jgi:hypothetical protein
MKGLAGYLLHPKIPTDQDGLRIADLGAGTGYLNYHPLRLSRNANVTINAYQNLGIRSRRESSRRPFRRCRHLRRSIPTRTVPCPQRAFLDPQLL